jgi:hypothetical protein
MKSNNTWKVSLLVTILVIGVLRAAPPESTTESKTVKLFAREAWITVLGKTTTVMTLTQANGEEGCKSASCVNIDPLAWLDPTQLDGWGAIC